MTVWWISDTHFGHSSILRHCSRPFDSVDLMDRELIARWNAFVHPKDTVWHLGDFAYRAAKSPGSYLEKLNGFKHLVHGNHDNDAVKKHPFWSTSQPMAETKVDGVRIIMLHYSMRVWPASHYGSLHLYGHSHGRLPGDRQSLDVGVDAWDFRPARLEEIQRRLLTLPERHGRQALAADAMDGQP